MIDKASWRRIWRVGCAEPHGLQALPHPLVLQRHVVDAATYQVERRIGRLADRHVCKLSLAGCGELRIGRQCWPLPAGTALLLCQADLRPVYGYPGPSGGEPWEWIMCSFRGADDAVRELLEQHGPVFHLGRAHPLVKRLESWKRYDGSLQRPGADEGAMLVYHILRWLDHAAAPPPPEDPADRLVRLARRALTAHREDPEATIAGVASELGVSAAHLARTFRERTGRTPRQEWQQERMQRAAELLIRTAEPVSVIARRLGYSNAAHLARAFKARYGCAPSQWRIGSHHPHETELMR